MIPFKSIIKIDRHDSSPLFLQISKQIVSLIKDGTLATGSRLPGTRVLSELLSVHRKTVIAAYDELHMQGWIEMIPQKGSFVNSNIPILSYQKIEGTENEIRKNKTGFQFYSESKFIEVPKRETAEGLVIDDGVCDYRLTPKEEIARIYRNLIVKKTNINFLSYDSAHGNPILREVLSQYLNQTRGLKIGKENILITRGSQMGIYLSAHLCLQKGDSIIVGETNYQTADITFESTGAKLHRVGVDEEGLKTSEISQLCQKQKIKAVYITSHHHHPTTVTFSAERRIRLLNLAKEYGFAIIEDDYDYDFHYSNSPILPLASHDNSGNVIYIGSICKLIAPVFRVGYLVAPANFVDEAAKFRRYVDRQGDSLLELTFARFIKNGDLDRHIKKVLKIYRERRDLSCELLDKKCGEFLDFEKPKGGMAIWIKLKAPLHWEKVNTLAHQRGLFLSDSKKYDYANSGHNGIRFGFASLNLEELKIAVHKLKGALAEAGEHYSSSSNKIR